jgi:hypothetical protein
MTTKEQLIEQHIREYESRLRHIDELYDRAREAAGHPEEDTGMGSELRDLKAQMALLRETTEEIKSMPVEKWRGEAARSAGPMAIWDIVAQKLENFIERHE